MWVIEDLERLLTGWRMKKIQTLFFDTVERKHVNLYVDNGGKKWMATSSIAWYRIEYVDGDS